MTYTDKQTEYATFTLRAGAFLIDSVILILISMVVGFLFGILSYVMFGPAVPEDLGFLIGAIVGWLFYALCESSETMATPGKMALGLQVRDENLQRLSFGRATGRHFAKFFSNIILGIGYLFPLWTVRRQTLHDIVAKAVVIKR